jgi:hypothetical protein
MNLNQVLQQKKVVEEKGMNWKDMKAQGMILIEIFLVSFGF